MKKWLLILVALIIIPGCSFTNLWKWMDKMDWERDDQTVRVVDFFVK